MRRFLGDPWQQGRRQWIGSTNYKELARKQKVFCQGMNFFLLMWSYKSSYISKFLPLASVSYTSSLLLPGYRDGTGDNIPWRLVEAWEKVPNASTQMDSRSKSFGTLFVHQPFWNFWQKKGGGVTKSRNFWALFTLIFVKYDQKSAPKVPHKKTGLRKSVPKVPKVWGGGEEVHN